MTKSPNPYHTAARARVERLLSGEYRPEDFTRLLLYLRARSYGRQAVIEVGDFVAHADERHKGICTDCVRDFFYFVRVRLPYPATPLNARALPAYFPNLLRANARRLNESILDRDLGMSRKRVERYVESIVRGLSQNADGSWQMSTVTPDESRVANCLSSYMVSQPAFDDERLFDEFCETLEKNKLLDPSERPNLAGARLHLGLNAIANMHLCQIELGDKTHADLRAHVANGAIDVGASVPLEYEGKALAMVFPLFTTNILASVWCDDSLSGPPGWDFGIEVRDGRLARIA